MITDREIIIAIVDNDCFTKSDAAVLLEGDGFFRFQKAVDLYNKGLVSKIVFSGNIIDKDYGSYPFEEVKPYILNGGVPEKDIIHEVEHLDGMLYVSKAENGKLYNADEYREEQEEKEED